MRFLIYILALTSAFFVSADEVSRVPAKEVNVPTSGFTESHIGSPPYYSSFDEAYDAIRGNVCEKSGYTDCVERSRTVKEYPLGSTKTRYVYTVSWLYAGGQGFSNNLTLYASSEIDYVCPPDASPNFTVGPVQIDGQNLCEEPPKDCSAGYHSKAVSKALGSSDCVPKECPPAGSGESLYTSPNLGTSFSGGGMYCNDGCAYSVSGANITSDKHATGTSQGAACGDKPYDNKKLADEGDNDKCSTASNGDVTILSCEEATPTNDPKPPLDNDDSKTGDEPTPDKPKENCAEGDTVCNLKNLEIQMQNSTQQTIDNQNKLHNKQVDVQTKNTQSIIDSIAGLDTSIYLQTQQDERLHAVTVSKFNELIGAVNGLETGGGGGSGSGNGDGSGEPDCEGSAADCVPIEGGDLPVETVNLEQYADKYDDWLPNAELPDEKCIVLTTGKSICLSFEAFILLFKAISGLLVIGALMHSAKIIAGAV